MKNTKDQKTITITEKEYRNLKEDSNFMRALERAGVDNWEGYEIAQDYLEETE